MSEVDAPVVDEPVAPVDAPPEPVADPADPEAAELAELEQNAVALPDGDGIGKYVPLSAVTKARDEAKTYRNQAKDVPRLQAELEAAQKAIAASQPYVEAAKALLSQQPAQPQAPQGPSAEEQAELAEVAKDLDFYKTDGSLDLDRAGRHQARILKAAQQMAQAQVAPLQLQNEVAKAGAVLNQAIGWEHPVTKEKADPTILRNAWNRVSKQPGGLEALANPEAAAVIWSRALLETQMANAGKAPVQRTPAPDGPPVFVEPSGGGTHVPALSSMEKKAARDLGMSEADYLKAAAKAPRG